jgi:hypothetical protein
MIILTGVVGTSVLSTRLEKTINTFSNGCLGSHIDEERSEMRYVMRIAQSVSHQNFERILHFPLRGSMSVGVSVLTHHPFFPSEELGMLSTAFCSGNRV